MIVNITVLKVELQGPAPVIEVMATEACKQIEGYKFATINRESGRHSAMRALYKGCVIQWQCQPNIH